MKTISEKPRCLILQVITTHYHRDDALANMDEAEKLVDTLGGEVVHREIQHRVKPHPGTYIGDGKVAWLQQFVKHNAIDIVIINDIIKAGQLFRLEKTLWDANHQIQVWDRVDLILNIFEKHASTTEAKLQIELARIEHDRPRIYGLGKDRLSRQGGGIGTRGAGETNIEKERRVIKDRQAKIKQQLKKLNKQKQHTINRRIDQGLGPVALVGYTSAGKTTLFNTLTGKDKVTDQGLFTTLDTVVGKMKTENSELSVLVSDTIGFIQNLPPILIKSFQSTLMESLSAQLILHVIDVSDPMALEKIEVVTAVLEELDVVTPQILVFNKIDKVAGSTLERARAIYRDCHQAEISAQSGEGIDQLKYLITLALTEGLGQKEFEPFAPDIDNQIAYNEHTYEQS